MPQFNPGESKTARAPITVKPSGLSCSAELYLVSDGTKVATSGTKTFTSTRAKQDISFSITMPSAEGTYPVYLDIFTNGLLIGAYKATEDVVIAPAAEFVVSNLSVSPSSVMVDELAIVTLKVTNVGEESGEYKLPYNLSANGKDWGTYILWGTLGPGESVNRSIKVRPPEAGTWTISIGGQSVSFEAIALEFATADVTAFGYPDAHELVGVRVEIVGLGYCITKYGYAGHWEPCPGCFIENVPPGTHDVRMSLSGYKTGTSSVTFKPGEMRTFFFRLYKA